MSKIKVAIVEDDENWLKTMTDFLERFEDIEVVWTALTRADAIETIKSFVDTDVVLMDINLNGNRHEGIFTVLDILEFKTVKVIMLSSLTDDDTIKDSFTAGAVNYIIKSNYKDIPDIIRQTYNDISSIDVLLKEFMRLKKEEQLIKLTPSEREVFGYKEKGYKQIQIEKMLFKAESTVKAQVKSILRKLNVKSSKKAVKKVNNRGLLEDEHTSS